MITLKESVHNLYGGVTVLRMIVVMEVNFWLRSLDGPSPLNFIELCRIHLIESPKNPIHKSLYYSSGAVIS